MDFCFYCFVNEEVEDDEEDEWHETVDEKVAVDEIIFDVVWIDSKISGFKSHQAHCMLIIIITQTIIFSSVSQRKICTILCEV